MKILSFYAGGYAANSYYVSTDDGKGGIIVDPAILPSDVFSKLGYRPEITAIVLTHVHFDHMLTLDEWRSETNAPLCIGKHDAEGLHDAGRNLFYAFSRENKTFAPAERLLAEGDVIAFGDETLTVLETPGHTAGSLVLAGDGVMLTGDTLFAFGDVGRTDFPSGNAMKLTESLKRLCRMKGDYTLYPGHGPTTTLRKEAAIHGIDREI